MYRPILFLAALALLAAPTVGAQSADAVTPTSAEAAAPITLTPPASPFRGGGGTIYTNGPLANCDGCGVDGADESILFSALEASFGFGAQSSATNTVGDDFIVPSGETWAVDSIYVYTYQSFAGTKSLITEVQVTIYPDNAGAPDTANPITDCSTSGLVAPDASGWTGVYRVTDSTTGTNADRAIWFVETTPSGSCMLTEGTYWIAYTFTGDGAFSGPWVPPVPLPDGTACYTGNAVQSTGGGAFATLLNGTCPAELPFVLAGTVTGGVAVEDGPGLPGEFALGTPTPNPAAVGARAAVTVERAQSLAVEVYDVLGRRVATLHDGAAPVGTLSVSVDASTLPAGVYVLRATGERGTVTRAFTVAR